MKWLILLVPFSVLMMPGPAFSFDDGPEPSAVRGQEPAPSRLFNWSDDLNGFARALTDDGNSGVELKLTKRLTQNAVIHDVLPGLRIYNGFFGWTHPVTAMAEAAMAYPKGGRTKDENYNVHGEYAVLFEFKPNIPRQKILTVTSVTGKTSLPKVNLKGIALIHHIHIMAGIDPVFGGKIKPHVGFEEWVVIDPSVIKNVTADPDVLRPIFKKEYEFAKKKKNKYANSDLYIKDYAGVSAFANNPFGRELLLSTLKNNYLVDESDRDWKSSYLDVARRNIPKKLWRPMRVGSILGSCQALLAE